MPVSANAIESLRVLVADWTREQLQTHSLVESEEAAEAVRRESGEVVLQVTLQRQTDRATYQGVSVPCVCGRTARFVSYRDRWVKSVCEEAKVRRAYYHCRDCGKGRTPWDEEQGLDSLVW